MIDEGFDRIVDWMCLVVPRRFRWGIIQLSRTALGWRLVLYIGSLIRVIAHFIAPIRSEESMDVLLHKALDGMGDAAARFGQLLRRRAVIFARLDHAGLRLRFFCALFLSVLAAFGVLAVGTREMALCALACLFIFLSDGLEIGYRPVCGRIRQRYVLAMLLRAAGLSVMILPYFLRYLMRGVSSNVVLQSAMVIMLGAHMLIFLILIAFNGRQPLLLRTMSGLLGMGPALMAATAAALFASELAGPAPLMLAALCRLLGAGAAFVSDRLSAVMALGGIRLRYGAVWMGLLETGGLSLMILGAWLGA